MNYFTKIMGILAISTAMAQAVEYKTLSTKNYELVSLTVLPTDKIEILGKYGYPYSSSVGTKIRFDGESQPRWFEGNTFPCVITGIDMVQLEGRGSESYGFVTISITHTEELSKVGPTSVLVIPENSTGNYDVVVESSGDMTTWSPFVSQTVQSDAAKNFFRVRIVKK